MLKYLSGLNTNTMNRSELKKSIIRQQMNEESYPMLMAESSYLGKAKLKQVVKQAAQKAKQATQQVKQVATKVVKTTAVVGLAPARAAFLVLVSGNIAGIAKKMAAAYRVNPTEVLNFWNSFGGNPAELKKAISKGAKVAINGIGAVTATVTATATPIVVKAIAMFQKLGIKPETLKQVATVGKKVLATSSKIKKSKTKVDADKADQTQVEVTQTETPSQVPTSAERTSGQESPQGTDAKDSGGSDTSKTPLIIGAVALAAVALFALKGKKINKNNN